MGKAKFKELNLNKNPLFTDPYPYTNWNIYMLYSLIWENFDIVLHLHTKKNI